MNFDIKSLPINPKILIVRLRSIGDVTLSTALFPSIKKSFPHCKLDYLVTPPNDDLVQGNPHLDEIILQENLGLLAFYKLIIRLRKVSYDIVIDLHGGPRTALITTLSRAKYKVGLARSRRAWFYNVIVNPVFESSVPAVKFQARILELLGFEIQQEAPKIHVTENELKLIKKKLVEMEIGSDYAVIHPGVNSLHNEWQKEKFAEVADTLQDRWGLKIIFTCAPDQMRQVEEILKNMKTPHYSLAGQTTLREFAALVKKSKFLLCHNSGPMHIAAALNTPVFALFGSAAPERWIPQVEPHHVFYKKIECSPCTPSTRKLECYKGNAECKSLISSSEVIQAIGNKLNLPSLTLPSQTYSD